MTYKNVLWIYQLKLESQTGTSITEFRFKPSKQQFWESVWVSAPKKPPKLAPLSGEELQARRSNSSNEAMTDIKTWVFREQEQHKVFDLTLFDSKAYLSRKKSLPQCHVMNEQEKKRACNERILQMSNQWQYGKKVPKVIILFGIADI